MAAAFAASFAFIGVAGHAQQGPPAPPRLEDLIPDSAVENPAEWVQDGIPAERSDPEAALPESDGPATIAAPLVTDANAPLAEMPLVTIPWPEEGVLPSIAPLAPEGDIQFVDADGVRPIIAGGDEMRLSDELLLVFPTDDALIPERDELVRRFEALSTIEELDDDNSVARLGAQAQEDEDLLLRLLRIYGYYDAQVIRTASGMEPGEEGASGRPAIRFDILPGPQYRFGAIELGALEDNPALRDSFALQPGDPLLSDAIEEERYRLDERLGESGYPFAIIEPPELLVDHAREEGDLTMPVTPAGRYEFGAVTSNLPGFLPGEHLARIARFEPGDIHQRHLELDLRQAILATGLVSRVAITPVPVEEPTPDDPGTVDLAVELAEADLRTIAGSIGYGTGEGVRVEGSWEHRNLFPPEGMLRVYGIAGTQEQLLGALFQRSNAWGRDRVLTLDAFVSTIDTQAYDAQTISLLGSYELLSNLLFQKPFAWSIGLELVATREQEANVAGVETSRETYLIAALPLFAEIDTTDQLLDPSRGFRLAGRLSPEISSNDGVQHVYPRSRVDASYYRQVSEDVVLAGRVRLGSIPGVPLDAIAPSRRFYAGGGASVRGYGYQAIGPRNAAGEPSGGRSLTELSLEARVRTGLLGGALAVVPFVDAGAVDQGTTPTFDDVKFGAGVGIRYFTGFGPIRVDVGVPLNPGPDDAPVGVYVGLGQAF